MRISGRLKPLEEGRTGGYIHIKGWERSIWKEERGRGWRAGRNGRRIWGGNEKTVDGRKSEAHYCSLSSTRAKEDLTMSEKEDEKKEDGMEDMKSKMGGSMVTEDFTGQDGGVKKLPSDLEEAMSVALSPSPLTITTQGESSLDRSSGEVGEENNGGTGEVNEREKKKCMKEYVVIVKEGRATITVETNVTEKGKERAERVPGKENENKTVIPF